MQNIGPTLNPGPLFRAVISGVVFEVVDKGSTALAGGSWQENIVIDKVNLDNHFALVTNQGALGAGNASYGYYMSAATQIHIACVGNKNENIRAGATVDWELVKVTGLPQVIEQGMTDFTANADPFTHSIGISAVPSVDTAFLVFGVMSGTYIAWDAGGVVYKRGSLTYASTATLDLVLANRTGDVDNCRFGWASIPMPA